MHFKQESIMKSKEVFLKCIELDPHHTHAYVALAFVYNVHGFQQEAIKICKECKEHNKDFFGQFRMWAFALFKKGDIPKAIKKIKKAILHYPKDADNWVIWGLIMRTVGNYESALQKFEKAHKLDKDN